jgi:hypothetical protein
MTAQWTPEDQDAAVAKGWGLFDASDSENDTPYQLQASSDAGLIWNDDDAWMLVVNNARAGEPLERKALAFLKERSPNEYDFITKIHGDLED